MIILILWNLKQLDRRRMKIPYSSLTCQGLAQKIIYKVDDPVAQRVHNENAERMLLGTFITGLIGAPGLQLRYSNPGIPGTGTCR